MISWWKKNAIYDDPDATEADSMRAAELEAEFGEMNGWMVESDAAELLSNLGVKESKHDLLVKDLDSAEKVKVLLAQALFGSPDILLMDEPTNDLDAENDRLALQFFGRLREHRDRRLARPPLFGHGLHEHRRRRFWENTDVHRQTILFGTKRAS